MKREYGILSSINGEFYLEDMSFMQNASDFKMAKPCTCYKALFLRDSCKLSHYQNGNDKDNVCLVLQQNELFG